MPAFKRAIYNKGKPTLPNAIYLTLLLVLLLAPGLVPEPVPFLFMFWFFVSVLVRFCTVPASVLGLDLAPALSAVWGKGKG